MSTTASSATSSNLLQFQQRKGDALLNLYVHDYLIKHKLYSAGSALAREADLSPTAKVPIDAPQSLLYEWWAVFWDILSERASQAARPSSFKVTDALLYTQRVGAGPLTSQLASQHAASSAPSPPAEGTAQRRNSLAGRGRGGSPQTTTTARFAKDKAGPSSAADRKQTGEGISAISKGSQDTSSSGTISAAAASPAVSSPTIPIGFGANDLAAPGQRMPQQNLVIRAMVSLGWAGRPPESLVPDEKSRLQREMARLAPMDDAMRRSIGSQQNGPEPDISALRAAAKAQQDAKHAPITTKRPRQVPFSMHQQGVGGSPSSEAGPSDLRKHPPPNPQQRSYDAPQQVRTANPRSPSPYLGRTPSPISMQQMPSVGTLAEQARDFEQQQALARSLQHQSRTMMNSAPRTPGPPPPEGPPWQFGDLLGVPRELHLPSHPQSHASGSAIMSKSDSAFERATADARSQLTAQIQSLQNQSPNGVRTPGTEAQIHQLRRLQGRLAQQNTFRSPTMPETPPRSDIVVNAAHLRTPGSSGTSQSNAFHFIRPPYDSSPSNIHFEPHVAVPPTYHHLNGNDNERGQYQGSGAAMTSSAPMSVPVFSGQQQHLSNHPSMQNIASSGFAHHGDPFDGLAPLLVHQDPNYASISGIDFSFGQDPRPLPP